MNTTDRIREPIVMRKIAELKGLNKSWKSIANTLNSEFKEAATVDAYKKVYDEYAIKSAEVLEGNTELKNQVVDQIKETQELLKEICESMRAILKDEKTTAQGKTQAAHEILNQLYFKMNFFERLQDGFKMKSTFSKIEYTRMVVDQLDELQNQGYIKIIRKPGMASQPLNQDIKDIIALSNTQLRQLNETHKLDTPSYHIYVEDKKNGSSTEYTNGEPEENIGNDTNCKTE